ncbi:MAG: DUF465 domain-containing protein [Deltaproteobacteria bacterium]|nr:DUF465 domain-containing protein [Deltaproteobacteria bacterium]
MESYEMSLIKGHLSENPELSGLWQEHHDYEKRLAKLGRKSFLSLEEEMEERRLKLAKLKGKTRMAQILETYKH